MNNYFYGVRISDLEHLDILQDPINACLMKNLTARYEQEFYDHCE